MMISAFSIVQSKELFLIPTSKRKKIEILQNDRVVYIRKASTSASSESRLADQSETVPDLVPAQEANAFSNCKDKE